jgi:predicted anti-sigma-YlaC factor YlaD
MDKNNKISLTTKISLLWIIVLLNMAFADILSLYIPGIHEVLAEFAGDTPIANLMLIGAIAHQIPLAMVFLSRVLRPKLNKIFNIVAAVLTIVYVVGGGSALPHYLFIASIEVLCLVYIIWLSVRLKESN